MRCSTCGTDEQMVTTLRHVVSRFAELSLFLNRHLEHAHGLAPSPKAPRVEPLHDVTSCVDILRQVDPQMSEDLMSLVLGVGRTEIRSVIERTGDLNADDERRRGSAASSV